MAIQSDSLKKEELVQLIPITIANEEYGIPISDVIEIIRLPKVQRLPRSYDFIKGIINLRGEVIPIVWLRKRFGLDEESDDKLKRTVIVRLKEQKIGMIVDSVSKVIRIPVSEIKDPPNFSSTIGSEFIKGVILLKDRMIILLNIESIFTGEEIGKIKEASGVRLTENETTGHQ